MSNEFQYLSDKIRNTPFTEEPFKHLLIENFFSDEHFELITTHRQVALPPQSSHAELVKTCLDIGYKTTVFPGALQDSDEYLKCLETDTWAVDKVRLERAGLVLNLVDMDPKLSALLDYFKSSEFVDAVRERIPSVPLTYNTTARIQKYLHGYEICPHCDRRFKALTWLININTDARANDENNNTKLLKLRKDKQFIQKFWEDNTEYDRDWLPWDWCENVSTFNQNNSMLLFNPDNDTLHGIKLDYDHLEYQRTQIYGNIDRHWDVIPTLPVVLYTEFDIKPFTDLQFTKYTYLIRDTKIPGKK